MLPTIASSSVQVARSGCVVAVLLHVLDHSRGGCALAGWCYAAVVLHVLWCVCSAGGCAVPLLCCIFRASRVVRVLWLGVFVLCSMFSVSRVVRVLWLGGCYAAVVHADPPLHSPPLHVGLFLHSHPHMWALPSAAPPCTQALSCTASPPHAGPLLYSPACMQSPVQPPPHAGPLLYSPACRTSPVQPYLSACTPSPL